MIRAGNMLPEASLSVSHSTAHALVDKQQDSPMPEHVQLNILRLRDF